MPNPTSPHVVAWYDFGAWPDLGGLPLAGGNVVLGGDLRQGATEGVFVHADQLAPGDIIQLYLADGRRLFYAVEFNKTAPVAGLDMTEVVRSTADESLTLVTASGAPLPPGQGKPGTYSDRRIVWARRLNCDLLESPATPTMNPLPGLREANVGQAEASARDIRRRRIALMLDAIVLWLHILGAVVFIGPQIFLAAVAVPAVRSIEDAQIRQRTMRADHARLRDARRHRPRASSSSPGSGT